jgi:hypothetical protein
MVRASPKLRKRLTQTEALEQAREQIRAEKVSRKPQPATNKESSGPRHRDQWISLPQHLAAYPNEQAVISQGHIWTHRVDRRAGWIDENGTKHYPFKSVYLGPADALNPNYQRENKGPGQQTVKGDKTTSFVLSSTASGSSDHLLKNVGVLSPAGGRPKKDSCVDLILQLAREGMGSKAIARTLKRDGFSISSRTVSRRLSEFKDT